MKSRGFLVEAAAAIYSQETHRLPRPRAAARIGNFVLRQEDLGVNDPNTHLLRYMAEGEAAMNDIEEDAVADFAERLEKPAFINTVRFGFSGNDFRSRLGNHSMKQMTDITTDKFAGVVDLRQYKRAKTEALEVSKLAQWFPAAKVGDAFVAESMGLTPKETYTLTRLYQKISDSELDMHVITLHGATLETFNQLHDTLGVEVPRSGSVLELLANSCSFGLPKGVKPKELTEFYVNAYDSVTAAQKPGQRFRFGLSRRERLNTDDDIKMVRRQKALRSIYPKTIRAIAQGNGKVSPELASLSEKLAFGLGLRQGQDLTPSLSAEILDHAIQYTMATLNRAPRAELEVMAKASSDETIYSAVGDYGGSAKSEGVRYEGACPSGGDGSSAKSEHGNMERAFRKKIAQCGNCGNCGKDYFVPDRLYKKDIVHCEHCDAAIHANGGEVERSFIDEYYGVNKTKISALDILAASWRKIKRETELERQAQQQAEALAKAA